MTGVSDLAPPRPLVGSWSCPTTVHAAAGAAARLPGLVGGRAAVVVRDGGVPPELAVPAGLGVAAQVVRAPDEGGWEFAGRIGRSLAEHPGAAVIAVGGGAVLDPARLAVLVREHPEFGRQVRAALVRPAGGPGLLFLPAGPEARADIICVPTTIGTAAEVSPVVVLPGTAPGAGAMLVVSPALRAATAVLDPAMTVGLGSRALALGLVEPLARALVPAVTGSAVTPADQLAAGLVAALLELGEVAGGMMAAGGTPDAAWRLAAALASASTHMTPLALGRAPLGHVLWPIAMELAAVPGRAGPGNAGPNKAEVLAGLLPAWLAAMGGLPDGFGTPARVAAVMGGPPATAALRLRTWLTSLGLPSSVAIPDPAGTAQAIAARWAPGFGHSHDRWEAALSALRQLPGDQLGEHPGRC